MIKETSLPFLLHRSSPVGPHTFRHAFAIISHKSGVDIYQIMRSLGHEKIETTMIYLEKIFEKERHAIHGWNPWCKYQDKLKKVVGPLSDNPLGGYPEQSMYEFYFILDRLHPLMKLLLF